MRLTGILVVGLALGAALSACATSEGVGGGDGGVGAIDGGGAAGAGGATGGVGGFGATGGAGTGGTSASGGTGGGTGGGGTGGATGGGGTGATGGGGTGGTGTCTPPVSGPCDTSPQCGCGAGLTCAVATNAGATQCVAPGTVQPYYACSSNNCVAGYSCIGGACKAYCEQDADCAQTSGACFQVNYLDTAGNPQPVPGYKVCSKKCKPENPASDCGPTLGCYVDNSVNPVRTDCAKAGLSTGAGVCSSDPTACAPGYACLTSGDCKHWCRVGFNSDCGGATCTGFAAPNQLFVDGLEYGVCP